MPASPITRRALSLTGLALLVAAALPARAAMAAVESFVRNLGDDVLSIVRNDGLSDAQRLGRIVERAEEAIDLELLGRLALARHWRGLTAAQQATFLEAYRSYGVTTVGRLLRNYTGEVFEITGVRAVTDTDSLVALRVLRPNGQVIRADMRVREQAPGDFVVIDILAEGISFLVTQRDQIGTLIDRNGFDGLIAELRARSSADGA